MSRISRRQFLRSLLGVGAAAVLPSGVLVPDTLAAAIIPAGLKPIAGGIQLGTVRFVDEGNFPLDTLVGSGLGGRLVLDLTKLSPATLVTPNDKFFIRTRFPDLLHSTADWKIRIRGLVEQSVQLPLAELMPKVMSMGTHLIECAGNTRIGHFGLISTAHWNGVTLAKVLEKVRIKPQATQVIVSGFDEYSQPSLGSIPGASWVFTFAQLEAAGAFLATGMNDLPLPKDHGFPVRFIMPNWYGCSCIKWINQIILVGDGAPATGHMKEYASRTHQDGVPELAKDFKPASIDAAAMPVRVEAWRVANELLFRVVGILWGGDKLTKTLVIRFNPNESYTPVTGYEQVTNSTWTVWTHLWRPKLPGRYEIQLKVNDPGVRTRRLGNGYYVRAVEITNV